MKQNNLKKQQETLRNKFLKKGVKMISPETIFFSNDTKIGKNVTIGPFAMIKSNAVIGDNVSIGYNPNTNIAFCSQREISGLQNPNYFSLLELSEANTKIHHLDFGYFESNLESLTWKYQ